MQYRELAFVEARLRRETRIAGDQDHRDTGAAEARLARKCVAVHPRHHQVGHQDVDLRIAVQDGEGARAAIGLEDLVAELAEPVRRGIAHERIVIDDEYGTRDELSTKQQSSAVEQVNAAIANVAQTTRETEVSARQTLDTVSQLAGLSRDLLRLVQPQATT